MAALTVVTKITAVNVITAMTAEAGFAEFNTIGHRAHVAGFAPNFKMRAVELETGLPVMIEFPE
jgi:hypothetical protein